MPRIKNVRIINAQYNNGKQMYQDLIMPFNGLSATYKLGNGGGKSVLLMLMMQCIIPNYTLNADKPFKSIFKGGDPDRTTHVLIEWELDGGLSTHKTLLTGFCAKKKSNPDEYSTIDGVEYFNYTHLYDGKNDLDIRRIPLCHMEGNTFITKSLSDTRKLLRDNSDKYNIWIGKLNGKGEYQEQIKKYSILGAEGKLIGSINESENQLKSYFKKSYGTSRTVIEKLLLNTTIECLNDKRIISGHEDDETNSKLLADTLYQSQEDIKRLNEELENIKETKAFHAEILKLVDANNRLTNTHIELDNTKHQTAIQYIAHKSAVTDKQNLIQDIDIRLEDARKQYDAVELEISKFETMQQNAIVNNGRSDISRQKTEKCSIESTLNGLDHTSKLAIATNKFIEIQKYETDILEYQRTIDNISKDNETISHAMNTYGKTLHFVLSEELNGVTTQYESEKLAKEDLVNESQQIQQKIGGIDHDIKSTIDTLGKLNIDLEKLRSDELDLNNECRKYPQLNNGLLIPEDELDATSAHIDALKDKHATLDETIDKLRSSIADDTANERMFTEKVKNVNKEIKSINDNISKFESQRSIVLDIVNARKSLDIGSCFNELDSEIQSTFENISSGKQDLDQLKHKLRTVEEYGFVLTKDFENALTWLKDKFGFAESGAEHLKNLTVDEQKTVLEQAPWLPKAIILTNDNFNHILANPTGKLTTAIMDLSIILISLSSLQQNGKLSLGDVFVPSRNAEHYIKILDKDNTIKGIKADILKIEQKLTKHESSLAVATNDRDTLKGFINQYPEGSEFKLHNQLEQNQAELNEYTTTLSAIVEQIKANSIALDQAKADISDTNTKLDTFSEKLEVLNKLIQTIVGITELQANIDENKSKLKHLTDILTITKRENEQLRAKIIEIEEKVTSISRQKEQLEADVNGELSEFATIEVEILEEKDARVLWAEYGSAKKTFEKVAGNVTQLNENIQTKRTFIQGNYTDIDRSKISIAEIKASGRSQPFSEEYISNLETQIDNIKVKLTAAEEKLSKTREKQVLLENKFDTLQNMYNARAPEAYVPDPSLTDENQFRDDITSKRTDGNRLVRKINDMEILFESNSEKLKQLESNLRNYEMLCDLYNITTTATIDTHIELKGHDELNDQLKSRQKSVDISKEKFRQMKGTVMNNISGIEMAAYFKIAVRDKLFVANDLKEARFNATALENYSKTLLKRIEDQQAQADALKSIEENVVNQALGIAKLYKDYIKKFPILSRIKFQDETYEMIRINFKKCEYLDEQAESEMRRYINDLIQDIQDNKIDKLKLADCLTPALLLNRVLDMKAIQMEMRKIDGDGIQKFLRWEQIEASDGETNAIFIVFIVVLMSYIRDIVIDRKDINTSKMLIIDNPFGSTSEPGLWEAIETILEKNNVQLICPGHNIGANLLKYFPVNFKLTVENAASGRKRVGIQVHAKDETLDAIKRQGQYGQIQFDVSD